MRRSRAPRRDEADGDRATQRIETLWANGLSATTARVRAKIGDRFAGHALEGEVLATKIVRDGVQIALANYFVQQRIYAWRIDGVTEGWIAAEDLQQRYRGWTVTSGMVWM